MVKASPSNANLWFVFTARDQHQPFVLSTTEMKTKLVVLSSSHLFVVLKSNTKLGKFMYSITKICHQRIRRSNTNLCVIFHKCLQKQNPCEKAYKFVLILQLFVCLDSVECMRGVEDLQCVLSLPVLNKDLIFFLLITAVKDKRMQENLTLVVS